MKHKQDKLQESKRAGLLQDSNGSRTPTSNFILITITLAALFIESISIVLSIFKNGLFKKEVLSKNSHLGFDLIIKNKKS